MTNDQKEFIDKVASYVNKYRADYNIKVSSPIIAQAILESGWGKSTLSAKYNNHFGLKCGSSWRGKSVNLNTKEEYSAGVLTDIRANFRAYDNFESGIRGYFEFINTTRYQNLKNVSDPILYINNIKADGYATSSTYVANLTKLIDSYNLRKYDNVDKISAPKNSQELKVGSVVTVSSLYRSAYDDVSKAVILKTYKTGTITRIKPNTHNPYLLDNGNLGWINVGDIRKIVKY